MITMVEMNRVGGVVWSVGCPWSGGLMPVVWSAVWCACGPDVWSVVWNWYGIWHGGVVWSVACPWSEALLHVVWSALWCWPALPSFEVTLHGVPPLYVCCCPPHQKTHRVPIPCTIHTAILRCIFACGIHRPYARVGLPKCHNNNMNNQSVAISAYSSRKMHDAACLAEVLRCVIPFGQRQSWII